MAEEVRFELTEHCCSAVFKTAALNRSATLPHYSNKFSKWIGKFKEAAQTIGVIFNCKVGDGFFSTSEIFVDFKLTLQMKLV